MASRKRQTPVDRLSIVNAVLEQRNEEISSLKTLLSESENKKNDLITQIQGQASIIGNLQSEVDALKTSIFDLNLKNSNLVNLCSVHQKNIKYHVDYNDTLVCRIVKIPKWIRKIFGA